ncbi:hypothetical protein CspHIS471_0313260 [Cutaneotrichosporon sp. HIS471]|nr:hypothetical protein CspHIS471_0313260 [Cutaneotrichosporon sp. HIS471]
MSSPGNPAPTTPFPLLPDELDDAVYDAHSTSSSLYHPSILYAQVQRGRADYDPFTDGFTNLTKRSIMSDHFELPDLPLPPDIWHRGSNSCASSALPSIKEVNEERRPIERVWW